MPYVLGIDLGGWHTAAVVSRLVGGVAGAAGWGAVEAVPLGSGTTTVPSVLYVFPDGSVRAGEPAPAGEGRAVLGFGRRVGDEVPLFVGGEPYTGQALLAALAMWVVDRVEEREGGPADQIVVSHPGGWGPYRVDLLHRALWRCGLDGVTLVPASIAAAEAYAAEEPVGTGVVLAVHDFDGGESAVVRRTDLGTFELLGCAGGAVDSDVDGYPGGIEPLLDDALFGYVGERLRLGVDRLDPMDPLVREGIVRLREECAAARHRLATAAEATIAVELPSVATRVVVTRGGFEELVRPLLFAALDTVRATVRSCGLAPGEVEAVVLAGGAARTPLVTSLLTASLPVRVDLGAEPELRIARGAALAARRIADGPVSLPSPGTGEIVRYDGPGRRPSPVRHRPGPEHRPSPEHRPGPEYRPSREYRPRPGRRPSPGSGGGHAVDRFRGPDTDGRGLDPHDAGEGYPGTDYARDGYVTDDYVRDDYVTDEYARGDGGEPPPRPPVRLTPIDLPKRGIRHRLRRDADD
ncbi:hypothetical protein GCM10023322_68020 [Rugosimonospora acidiphila]|uniref:Hsp70 protein n=1 Tax=Rugosimonospora acidiphila TaxID=556531 RepID=A0ABP9SLL1_9ACTN